MRVLFCAYDRAGHVTTGPNAWLQRLIPDLLSCGLDIITHFFYNDAENECPTVGYFKENNIPYVSSSIGCFPYTEDQVRELLGVISRNDISVVVANLVIPAFYTAKYLKRFNIPVIPVLHSDEPHTRGVITQFINNVQGNINCSVSVSELINSYVNITNKSKHKVIPCGTPESNIKAKVFQNELKIIYAGRIEVEQKQILYLADAFIECSTCCEKTSFSIYGNGRYQDELKALLATSCDHKVVYKGAVSPSEIQNVMSQHHVFTLMSDYEGMPVALMEAMACGVVPVCLAENSGVNEIIIDGFNGLIVKDRGRDYRAKLRLLLEDPELWSRLSNNAIKTIEERYSSKVTHQKWVDLLNSYRQNEVEKISTPKTIELDGPPLLYSDIRKPSIFIQVKHKWSRYWLQIRLAIRPRARLREVLKIFIK
ncbi:glycosyltransferase family 4 protein [Persicobacter psychrovividus]|uniref:Glycosyl transferase family 1 domain-containing protein n=1 Tax=Persicobacter psychrovividus TaxID=387638 RepID=A0ABN6LBA3_9BACT|nr:hypothetical protein PEPS_08820 [Persicobacter psychrovividus]